MIAALDDDPTGSQAVHDVQVVAVPDAAEYRRALAGETSTCFVLTNSRGLAEADARALTRDVAADLFAVAADGGRPLDLVSRSDSTLRGHVAAELAALEQAHREAFLRGYRKSGCVTRKPWSPRWPASVPAPRRACGRVCSRYSR